MWTGSDSIMGANPNFHHYRKTPLYLAFSFTSRKRMCLFSSGDRSLAMLINEDSGFPLIKIDLP